MKVGILGAMDCEIDKFCSFFSAKQTQYDGIYEGEYCGNRIYISLCGIGKVNAAANTQRLCDLFDVDYIINSGVAGNTSKNLDVCDIAISQTLTYHDFKPIDILNNSKPFTSVFKADEKLVECAMRACEKLSKKQSLKYECGMIVSGDVFVEDSQYVKHLSEEYNALCTEMEGAAIAHVCVLNNKPFVVIRSMSDNADEKAEISFDEMAKVAADRASFVAMEIISNYS